MILRLARPFRMLAPLVAIAALTAGGLAPLSAGPGEGEADRGRRGPGLVALDLTALSLPVARTADLAHVQPAHFGQALGNDPQRIFTFVRDHVAFEAYAGVLRGPRGTLLALAGNSADRAALLASLLEAAGQKVRFVRGTLPDAVASELIRSMAAERPAPLSGGVADPAASKAFRDAFQAGVRRDYQLIRANLPGKDAPKGAATDSEQLLRETREHTWVQWSNQGTWVDLDPTFADSVPGKAVATGAQPLGVLPPALFHRVTIRVRVEEYPVLQAGEDATQPTTRVLLTYEANAAALSGVHVVLTHADEGWKGPAKSYEAAFAAAAQDTGQVKPLLVLGKEWRAGAAFRQRLPAGGLGGARDALGGRGTREAVPVATAHSIEVDFIAPGGERETVVREVFDLVGRARRSEGRTLTSAEVRERIGAATVPDLRKGAYDLLFTTGGIHPAHLEDLAPEPARAEGQSVDSGLVLRLIGTLFAATSDRLHSFIALPAQEPVRLYPDSPRLFVAELATVGDRSRVALDLRRARVRAVSAGGNAEAAFRARIVRGVAEGALERAVLEFLSQGQTDAGLRIAMSTSAVFERAAAEGVPIALASAGAPVAPGLEDALSRLKEEASLGHLALVPTRAVAVGGTPRLAWWRIDPRTGETVGVTDEGLHGTTAPEKSFITVLVGDEVMIVATMLGNNWSELTMFYSRVSQSQVFWRDFGDLLKAGFTYMGPG